MKIVKNTGQQGDVIVRKLSSLPAGNRKIISRGKLVLAEGESTGHYHGIVEENSELLDIGGTIVLDLKEDATLTHQEHGPVTLEKGFWEVGRVQEYDYFSKMKRQVVD